MRRIEDWVKPNVRNRWNLEREAERTNLNGLNSKINLFTDNKKCKFKMYFFLQTKKNVIFTDHQQTQLGSRIIKCWSKLEIRISALLFECRNNELRIRLFNIKECEVKKMMTINVSRFYSKIGVSCFWNSSLETRFFQFLGSTRARLFREPSVPKWRRNLICWNDRAVAH